jgi:hypothetical protein
MGKEEVDGSSPYRYSYGACGFRPTNAGLPPLRELPDAV